jgi:hypothetical protein
MAPVRAPKRGSFEKKLRVVDVDIRDWVRLSRSPSTEPFYSTSASQRFDDPTTTPASNRFGVLYIAENLETAFAESVIHENSLFRAGRFEVSHGDLHARQAVSFGLPHAKGSSVLHLVDLTGAGLKRLGLDAGLCSSPTYATAQRWSRAIYDAAGGADGIVYMSRQNSTGCCAAVFDRRTLVRRRTRKLPALAVRALMTAFNVESV